MKEQDYLDGILDEVNDIYLKISNELDRLDSVRQQLRHYKGIRQPPSSYSYNVMDRYTDTRVTEKSKIGINTTVLKANKAESPTVQLNNGSAKHLGTMSTLDKFLYYYNNLPKTGTYTDKSQREKFVKQYGLKSFSCSNNEERVNNPSIEPLFKEEDSPLQGSFWAWPAPGGNYAVVPNQRLSYDETLHKNGGMKEVFDSNFESGVYNIIKVIKPAVLHDYLGKWRIKEPGRIQLIR